MGLLRQGFCKLLLLVFALTSCGQPLAMRTTPRATSPTASTPRSTRVAPLATLGIPETAPATPAPDSATATAAPAQTPTSSVVIRPQIPPTQTNEQRWRDQQANRHPYEPPRQYVAQPGITL